MNLFSKSEILKKVLDFYDQNSQSVLEIVGPTASGKTDFTVETAQFLEKSIGKKAEVIVVDSRQVYRECNISSAKITKEEMCGVVHWGIDLKNPDEDFSVYAFQQYAFAKIQEILNRGNIPILSGGTMLWLDSISKNYIFAETQKEKSQKKGTPKWLFLKVGIFCEREILYERINARALKQFENGLIEETAQILKQYDVSSSVMTSFGYTEIKDFLEGYISYDEALTQNQKRNRNYAKRQLTWWRGRDDVIWMG
ncbi:hypothetical protein KAI58_04725 [Candidatus Gracilibacteria bacterium]|nr:hypothetical protein [Candidatus Gracilibacteria bacterium]